MRPALAPASPPTDAQDPFRTPSSGRLLRPAGKASPPSPGPLPREGFSGSSASSLGRLLRIIADQTLAEPWVARLEHTLGGSPSTLHWVGRNLAPAADTGRDTAHDGAIAAVITELAHPLPPIHRDGWLTERHPSGFIVEVPEPSDEARSPNDSPYYVASAGACKVSYLSVLGAIDDLPRLLTLLDSAEHWKAQNATHLGTRPGPLPWIIDVDLVIANEAVSSRFALRPEGFVLLQAFGGPRCQHVRERFFGSLRFSGPLKP